MLCKHQYYLSNVQVEAEEPVIIMVRKTVLRRVLIIPSKLISTSLD